MSSLGKVELKAIASVVEQLDYYKLLKIPSHASEEEVRSAFHREALLLHPDRYQHTKDPELLDLSKKIYSKVIEAYRTLSSSERRREYDVLQKKATGSTLAQDFSGKVSGSVSGGVREESDENEITSVRRIEKTATTTAGHKFFKLAQTAFQSRDFNSAKMNIQIALNTDSKNPEYLDLLHRVEAELKKKKKS